MIIICLTEYGCFLQSLANRLLNFKWNKLKCVLKVAKADVSFELALLFVSLLVVWS